jgi:guanine deaminase
MTCVIKGQTLTFSAEGALRHEERGAVVVGDDGVILWCGPQPLLPQAFRQVETHDHGRMIVMPGFVDAHIHFPQYRMLAASPFPRKVATPPRTTQTAPQPFF